MILIITWAIAIALVGGLCLCVGIFLVQWFRRRPPKGIGLAFDVAKLGTRMNRAQFVARPLRVCRSAASESHRLERLSKAREYVAGLEFFADR